jgi:flagellar motor switch protein FliN/FliY
MPFTSQEWIDRFVADLATVVGALGGVEAASGAGSDAPSEGWVVTLRGDEGSRGDLIVEFDRVATKALTKRVMGMDDEPDDDAVVDTLKELCQQAAGSMVLEPPLVGAKLTIVSVERVADPAPAAAALAQITIADVAPLPLRLWGDVALIDGPLDNSAPAETSLAKSASAGAQAARYMPPPSTAMTPKLELILDIDLPLTVRFGRTEMPLRLIAALGPGSVIDLGRSPDDPVDVLVSNQLVARGEVVIVGGNYGVRITDVISPQNGVRASEDLF